MSCSDGSNCKATKSEKGFRKEISKFIHENMLLEMRFEEVDANLFRGIEQLKITLQKKKKVCKDEINGLKRKRREHRH